MRCTSPKRIVGVAALGIAPLLALLGAGLGVTMPGPARAITISGPISYSGSYAPVSSARPLRVVLHTYPRQEQEPLAEAVVSVSPGAFALNAPAAGDYSVAYWLDVNNDDRAEVGEPVGFGDPPLHVPASGLTGVTLALSDSTLLSGVAGTVTYTGSRGSPSQATPLVVEAFTDSFLSGEPARVDDELGTNAAPFSLATFDTRTYYLRAFLDLNHNGQLDPDEPFEIYQNKGSGAGDPVAAGPDQTNVNFTFGDSTGFPIATTAAPELTVNAAFDGSNFLVGIQTQTTVGAQLISPSGTTVGSLITTGRSSGAPAPGVGFNGTNYVLVWPDHTTGADVPLYGQLVSPSGAALGVPVRLSHSTTVRDQGYGGAFDGTNYLLAWTDTRLSATNSGLYYIYGQVVSADGTPLGSEIPISQTVGTDASIAFGGGVYLVVWIETATDATVMGRLISPAGTPLGAEFVINASSAESDNPKAVAFGRTNFLVVWPDKVGGGPSNLFGQLVTPTGALTGEVLPITSGPGGQFFPTLAFDGRNYLATWTNFTCNVSAGETCGDVHGQYLSQCGRPIGAAFPIGAGPGTQMISPVTFGAGQYLVLWNSDATVGQSGPIGGDVYGTFLAPAPVACTGDCGGDHQVTVDELLIMVNIALGNSTVCACEAGDTGGDDQITVDEIITGINNALGGC